MKLFLTLFYLAVKINVLLIKGNDTDTKNSVKSSSLSFSLVGRGILEAVALMHTSTRSIHSPAQTQAFKTHERQGIAHKPLLK